MNATVHTHPGVAFAVREGVAILLWTGDPTLAANRWAVGKITSERGATRTDMVLLQIITPGAGTPRPDARRFIQDAYARELSETQRIVTAPLGDSFRQALVRAITRGMALFAGKTDYVTVVSTLSAGFAAALRDRSSPTVNELDTCVDAMFAALGETRPG